MLVEELTLPPVLSELMDLTKPITPSIGGVKTPPLYPFKAPVKGTITALKIVPKVADE